MSTAAMFNHAQGGQNMANATYRQLPSTGFVRLPQVLAVIPISRATWWAWCKNGKAPAPKKIGPNITAWRAEDIHALIAIL